MLLGSGTATGDKAGAVTTSLVAKAAGTSKYPAPIVNTSYWLVKVWPVVGSVTVLVVCANLVAVFINRAFTVSGPKPGLRCSISAAAPLTIAADMLVPLSRK